MSIFRITSGREGLHGNGLRCAPVRDFDETPDRPTRKTPDPESPTIERRELHESTTDTGMGAAVDPLVRFYEHALYGDDDDAEDDHDDSKHTEEGGLSEHASAPPSEMPKRKGFKGYACQNTGQSKGTGLNDDIIAKVRHAHCSYHVFDWS